MEHDDYELDPLQLLYGFIIGVVVMLIREYCYGMIQ